MARVEVVREEPLERKRRRPELRRRQAAPELEEPSAEEPSAELVGLDVEKVCERVLRV